jgi:hypothetical protein
MNQFLTPLNVTVKSDGKYTLTSPLVFRSDRIDRDIFVSSGFLTDFASVPDWMPLAHLLFAETGKPAAVIHDFLLVEGKIPRSVADEIFLDALKCCPGVPKWKARAMHWGVSAWTWIKGTFK